MKIKELYQWQLMNIKKSLFVFYGIIYALYLFSVIIRFAFPDGEFNTNMAVSSAVFMLVSGIVFYNETFKFALCNSVSRKTVLISQVATLFSLSLLMSIIDLINYWFFDLVKVQHKKSSFFYMIYQKENIFELFLFILSLYLIFGFLGFFISALNYRMSKLIKLVFYIGIPLTIIVIIPLIISSLNESVRNKLSEFLSRILNYIVTSPYNLCLILLIISAVFYGLSILLVRKAPLKTV